MLLIGALLVLFPGFVIFYLICGALDVIRNRNLDWPLVQKYFLGHGALTWYLSPFNLLMDVLTLPYWNKGVYELKDLPKPYQDELTTLVETINTKNIVGQLEDKLKSHEREMIFFKWYGHNLDNVINFPEFHAKYKYIRTIGISVFNKRMSTSKHFGPFRMTLRVLYNINEITSDQVYIEVGDRRNYWRESKLFIFDDTLLHQSVNESDARRYCAFIDIMRPSLIAPVMSVIVYVFGWLFMKMNRIFYNGWEFVK
ncbi:MAG: aspartyl/asparaginyl beta-hydroxylase domain-containing protein [Burkholderiales bacterium]